MPPKLAPVMKALAPIFGCFIAISGALLPYFVMVFKMVYKAYEYLPTDLLEALAGLVFCFAGGLYPTFFAACEAARLTGWE